RRVLHHLPAHLGRLERGAGPDPVHAAGGHRLMATPTMRASGYNFATAGGTTNSITLSSSIAVGDRLYLMASAPYALTSGTDTTLVAAGWFRESNFPDTNWSAGSVYSKVAVSGDIGSTITVTHTTSV